MTLDKTSSRALRTVVKALCSPKTPEELVGSGKTTVASYGKTTISVCESPLGDADFHVFCRSESGTGPVLDAKKAAVAAKWISETPRGSRVLIVGIGVGETVFLSASKFSSITVLDPRVELLRALKQKLVAQSGTRIEIREGDVSEIRDRERWDVALVDAWKEPVDVPAVSLVAKLLEKSGAISRAICLVEEPNELEGLRIETMDDVYRELVEAIKRGEQLIPESIV